MSTDGYVANKVDTVDAVHLKPQATAIAPPGGLKSIQNVNGAPVLVLPDGTTTAIGGAGVGWVGSTALPFMVQQLGTNIMSFEFADFMRASEASIGGGSPPVFQTNQDGGVYRFGGAGGLLSFVGSQVMIASPTTSSWAVMTRVKLVGTPAAGDQQIWCGMNSGDNNNRIAFEINGPTSTTVAQLRFDKATVITRQALGAPGTIGSGITIGAWTTFALVFLTSTNTITAYVNGTAAGSRADMSSAGPTVGMMPWVECPAFSAGTFDLDKVAFATTGP